MKSEVKISGNRLQITRVFDAPRQVVFAWWTQAEKLQQWSGCKAATKCVIEMDFRVGGSFTQKMHIAGAGEFSFTGRYDEIVEPERISYQADFGQAITRVVVEFSEQGYRTRVVVTHDGFPDQGSCKTVSQGTVESLDKLASILADHALVNHVSFGKDC
jgi:uncharacterized protein YndB with AHSA1/START domain